jgi:hypothetical protein
MSSHEFFISNFIFVRYNMYEIYIFYTAITTRGFRKHDWFIWLTSPSPVIYVHIDATLIFKCFNISLNSWDLK